MPLLEMQNVSKEYNGNPVLKDVSFKLKQGEVLGLVGENGAGKSTLMNILFGMDVIHQTGGYGGKVLIDGKEVKFASPLDALKAGIGMVHQEFSLLPGFTAAENILLNREPENKNVLSLVFGPRTNTIDRKELQKKAIDAITKLGVTLDPDMLVSEMPVGHKQFTEISREISKSSIRLLVLDEPTAVLSEKEAEMLLKAIRNLSAQGISVIFITHRLQEILDVCNKVIVMRDGRIINELDAASTSIQEMARLMVGREVSAGRAKEKAEERPLSDKIVLSIKNLWVDMPGETVKDVNLEVHQGEFLGIGGLAGQGKIGIPNGIMGLYPAGGSVKLNGQEIQLNNPRACLDASLAFVSEDRRGVGLLLDESLEWNVAFTAMQTQNRFLKQYLGGLIKWRDQEAIKEITDQYINELQIKCTSSKQRAKAPSIQPPLSGVSLSDIRQKGEGFLDFADRFRTALVVIAVLLVIFAALYAPAQGLYCAWRDQGVQQEELAELAKTNEQYQSDIDRLQSREGIEDEARRRGYVAEGESEIVVDGTLPTDADQDGAGDEGIPWYLALGDFVFQYR